MGQASKTRIKKKRTYRICLPNKALHLTAIPLRFIAAGELYR